MSPEQKARRLKDIADEIDRIRHLIDAAEFASEAIAESDMCNALGVLLSEISDRVAKQAGLLRAAA